jgi:hypothetical protein
MKTDNAGCEGLINVLMMTVSASCAPIIRKRASSKLLLLFADRVENRKVARSRDTKTIKRDIISFRPSSIIRGKLVR